jgi:hypothetical protein
LSEASDKITYLVANLESWRGEVGGWLLPHAQSSSSWWLEGLRAKSQDLSQFFVQLLNESFVRFEH